jgi:hypothetical protein
MNSDIWLPLVTLVGGWGLAQVTETLRDRRTTDRERLARRAELQRTTLLTLQDHLLEVLKLSAIWDELDADERTRLRHATAEGRLLASRVEHEDARKAANDFVAAALGLVHPNADVTDEESEQVTMLFSRATSLIGWLLRERY